MMEPRVFTDIETDECVIISERYPIFNDELEAVEFLKDIHVPWSAWVAARTLEDQTQEIETWRSARKSLADQSANQNSGESKSLQTADLAIKSSLNAFLDQLQTQMSDGLAIAFDTLRCELQIIVTDSMKQQNP